MLIPSRRSLVVALSAGALMLLAPDAARAQSGPRWQAWLGCWSAVAPASSAATTEQPAPMLCVTPTQDADVVEISAIAEGKVVSRDRLDASGRPQAIDAGGCTGTTRANWSDDERRVFLKSSVTCNGQPSETSAILAMASSGGGEWLDVRSVSAGGNSEVRVARYRDIGLPSTVPSEIANVLRDRDMSVRNARIASTAPIGVRDIIEASRSADSSIVEAWLLESGQQYPTDAATLRQLADAGVPGRVTDAMLSERAREAGNQYASSNDRVVERVVPVYDPWGYGLVYRPVTYPVVRYRPVYGYAPIGFSFSLFGFGYAPYGYGYAPFGYYPYSYLPVGYVPFGYGFGYARPYGGRNYHRPIVVVRPGHDRPEDPRTAHPRVTRDQGYTEQRSDPRYDAGTRTAVERPRVNEQVDGRRGRTSESGRPERAASQPRQSGGGGRTAHGRP